MENKIKVLYLLPNGKGIYKAKCTDQGGQFWVEVSETVLKQHNIKSMKGLKDAVQIYCNQENANGTLKRIRV